MAEALNESLLTADESAKGAPRIRLSEMGYPGLKVVQKQIMEEADSRLRMPNLIKEIDKMKKDSTVAAALSFYKIMIGRVKWDVKAPVGASKELVERTKFIQSCMGDMKTSWFDFIQSTLTSVDYGFAPVEKVFKRRSFANSKYNDGLIGWNDLPIRAQSTISGWVFDDTGRELIGLEQSTANLQYSGRYTNLSPDGTSTIKIPREKFLLFRTSPQNGNPEGYAALKASWQAWRFKQEIEQQECLGLARDLGGLLKITMPARYLSPDASASEQAVAQNFQKVCRNVSQGEQSGIILPSDADEATKQKMFDAELLTSQGGKSYDTNEIITRLKSEILVSLFSDILQLGANATGSFALAGAKESIISFALDFRLREIKNVLDNDLIKSTFEMNGWDTKELPEFVYESVDEVSLDEAGKFLQRVTSVGLVEIDREVLNFVRKTIGLTELPADVEPREEYMAENTSRAGDGMATAGEGTSTSVSGRDESSLNTENAA